MAWGRRNPILSYMQKLIMRTILNKIKVKMCHSSIGKHRDDPLQWNKMKSTKEWCNGWCGVEKIKYLCIFIWSNCLVCGIYINRLQYSADNMKEQSWCPDPCILSRISFHALNHELKVEKKSIHWFLQEKNVAEHWKR